MPINNHKKHPAGLFILNRFPAKVKKRLVEAGLKRDAQKE